MIQKYTQPIIETISFANRSVLCMSGVTTIEQKPNIKKYGCPIKQGVDCPDYDKRMYGYEQWLKDLSRRQDNAIFHQGPDEDYCPRKTTCPIYLKWKKQQKTR